MTGQGLSLAELPIDSVLPLLCGALRHDGVVVLQAEPGAGKTTRVPAALLDAGLAGDKSIVVLEPRRIAARAAAEWVARERGKRLGDEVGFQVRFARKGGASTRVWFMTQGLFARKLANDAFLDDVGILVLDEFHERHLSGDVALAVARELRRTVRPDLRLLVMSATLDTVGIARYLGGCPVVECPGRAHPVEIVFDVHQDRRRLPERVASAVSSALAADLSGGDVLVFLPGVGEIRRCTDAIAAVSGRGDIDVLPLHGDLPLDRQRAVLQAGARRRVVLATNVAETSVTVDGVSTVIDSGLARVAELDSGRGINRLRLAPISKASADQRAGRAGRQGPGRCVRLWTADEHASRREQEVPEIRRAELSSAMLELQGWGVEGFDALEWLDEPPPGAVARARVLLTDLGAISPQGQVGRDGHAMMRLPASPRVARLLLDTVRSGCRARGALAGALLGERDVLVEARSFADAGAPRPAGNCDLSVRIELFERAARRDLTGAACRDLGLEPGAVRVVERARSQYESATRDLAGPADASDDESLRRALLRAFPDRVARRRRKGEASAVMVGGTGIRLAPTSVVRDAHFFIAIDLTSGRREERSEATVRMACAIHPDWLEECFPEAMSAESVVEIDEERGCVVEIERFEYRDLTVSESRRRGRPSAQASQKLADFVRRRGSVLGDTGSIPRRLELVRHRFPDLGMPDPEELLSSAVDAACAGKTGIDELGRIDLAEILAGLLTYKQRQALATYAPLRFEIPSGRAAAIDYVRAPAPTISARVQELFGLVDTPRLVGGAVPLVVELLAPNNRPVQITEDLRSFWENTYPEVRKQLRGRYPKHDWPEDPSTARASRGPKKRRTRAGG